MKLEQQHRECLLDALDKANEELENFKSCALKFKENGIRWDIHIFLEQQRIELIKKSLIANEIDY